MAEANAMALSFLRSRRRRKTNVMELTSRTMRRHRISPITRRILAVNILALLILAAGMLYLADYRRGLISAELAALRTQTELFAAALGEGTAMADAAGVEAFVPPVTTQMVRRLVEASGTRARLFGIDGTLLADSRLLVGPGGTVQIQELPPPPTGEQRINLVLEAVVRMFDRHPETGGLEVYEEKPIEVAADYSEIAVALKGEVGDSVRAVPTGGTMLSVAAPVQRYKQVLGALMLSKDSREIDAAVLGVRIEVLKIFAVTLVVTVLLSLYLAGTIARPLLRLAAAAERVRRDRSLEHTIPDYSRRNDEIGILALALREMTAALRLRMDAIERFAADVAHEIKNPLTSLRSAVETAARVNDPDQRCELLRIIEDDVCRLDRLISDISDASRLDVELARAQAVPVNLRDLFTVLLDVMEAAAKERNVHLRVDMPGNQPLVVYGLETRLVQVYRNLLVNALSFSPPGGQVRIRTVRDKATVITEVVDDGPGIPEGKERSIFERFYSERPQGEKFGTHSGLGLSISKQIVEALEGTIYAENRRRRDGTVCGARFIVRLPAAAH
ncbi:MAG: stimulus-sensing domain-containing protein [Hyphomicrobium sp.]